MKYIMMAKGRRVMVDDTDYDWLNQWRWRLVAGYACRMRLKGEDSSSHIYMHRMIMDAPKGTEVDHINHDELDNTRQNLRIASHQENAWNRDKQKNNTSGYNGVTWVKKAQRWRAAVAQDGKSIYLGQYKDIKEAVKARDAFVMEHRSGFAVLNTELEES